LSSLNKGIVTTGIYFVQWG